MITFCGLSIYELTPSKEGITILNDIIYDISTKFIIVAPSNTEARKMAQAAGSDECRSRMPYIFDKSVQFWTDSKYSTCKVIGISTESDTRIIANVFSAG